MRWLLLWALGLSSCSGTVEPASTTPSTASRPAQTVTAQPRRYQVVSQKSISGACDLTRGAEGLDLIDCAWMNNGRGPKIHAEVRSGADATPLELRITGTDTFGVELDETFQVDRDRARWASQADSGEATLSGPAFYLPASPLPPAVATLARAAIAAGGRLALLPSGEVRVEHEADTVVHGRPIHCHALLGVDFTPVRVWLDDELELFAMVNPWWSLVPDGMADIVEPLAETERRLQAERDRADAKRLSHAPPAAGLAFVGARVFDAVNKQWRDDWTVVVTGSKIAAAGPSSKVKAPPGAQVVEALGKALIPGLWDMHTHLGSADGPLNIAAGVTTVRDMANDSKVLADLADRWSTGLAVGPRVLRVGVVEGRSDKALASEFYADSEAEGRAAIDFYASHGYLQLKFYNSMKPELVPLLARAAHDKGLRVSGHVPYGMLAEDALRAGYDEVQHINQVLLELFADRRTDTRTLKRFTLVGEQAATLDLESRPVTDYLALLREHDTVIDPTMVAFEELFLARPGVMDPTVRGVAHRLPPLVARTFLTGGLEATGETDALYRASWQKVLAFLAKLHGAGLRIVAGTDGMAGFWLHRELEIYSEAGIANGDILQIATLGAAKVVGLEASSGSIDQGKDADLVLLDGDPLARIADIRKVISVVKGGVLYDSAEVYASVGVTP